MSDPSQEPPGNQPSGPPSDGPQWNQPAYPAPVRMWDQVKDAHEPPPPVLVAPDVAKDLLALPSTLLRTPGLAIPPLVFVVGLIVFMLLPALSAGLQDIAAY